VGVVYSCCWSFPAQSFSGPSPAGLMTIFYSLRFETSQTWRSKSPYFYPPGTGFPFRHLLRLAELRWKYSTQPPWFLYCCVSVLRFFSFGASIRCCGNVFMGPLHSNGRFLGCCVPMCVSCCSTVLDFSHHVTVSEVT
jgi:hypothetical protein